MGDIGGILPDIDANQSVILGLIFSFLAPVFAFFVVFAQQSGSPVLKLFLIWLLAFFGVKYPLFFLFIRFTKHRGLIHSVPGGILFSFLGTILLHKVFLFSDVTAWMAGLFLFFGFVIHLILDEISSIDFSQMRLKKSFGTALKLGDSKDPTATSVLYVTIIGLYLLAPDPGHFLTTILDRGHYLHIQILP